MGRAIVRNPKVFLFDEPLSNLDAKLRVQMRTEIKRLHQRLGATMIFVTHDQVEAMTMAEQIIVLREGRIAQVGTPLELYDRPANLFVAGFIGSPAMNLVPGAFEDSGGELRFIPQDGTPISAGKLPCAGSIDPDRQYMLGLRPEHIALPGHGDDSGGGESSGEVQAEVVLVEVSGLDTHIVARAAHGEVSILVRGRFDTDAGNRLALSLNLQFAHIFDFSTGERVN